jgi:hypothetical protein
MIGSLLYATATRPDIMHVVCQVGRFQASPKTSHLLAVKRIFRYLKGTIEYGLWYPTKVIILDLYAFTDANWAVCVVEDIHIHYNEPIPIFCDNTSAISISKNPVMH